MTSLRTAGELLPVDVTDRLGIYALGHLSKRTHQCICLCSASVMALTASNCALLTLLLYLQFSWCPTIGASPLHRKEDNKFGESARNWRTILTRDRESLPDYQPLCHSINHRVDLQETGYEFRPPFYHSIECKHNDKNSHHRTIHDSSEICLQSGLACVQRTKMIQIAKRKIGTSCWTLLTKEVHSGCECMWPVQSNGDLRHHFT